jgi:hypothetical protein
LQGLQDWLEPNRASSLGQTVFALASGDVLDLVSEELIRLQGGTVAKEADAAHHLQWKSMLGMHSNLCWMKKYYQGGLGFWVEDTEGFADANKWKAESVAATPRE